MPRKALVTLFFFEVDRIMEEIGIEQYLKPEKISNLGRPGYNRVDLLKTSLFGAMDNTLATLRQLEDACKVNLRYRHLMKNETPSCRTFGNFIAEELSESIEDIFKAVMEYIGEKDNVDLQHLYIDGSKSRPTPTGTALSGRRALRSSDTSCSAGSPPFSMR